MKSVRICVPSLAVHGESGSDGKRSAMVQKGGRELYWGGWKTTHFYLNLFSGNGAQSNRSCFGLIALIPAHSFIYLLQGVGYDLRHTQTSPFASLEESPQECGDGTRFFTQSFPSIPLWRKHGGS